MFCNIVVFDSKKLHNNTELSFSFFKSDDEFIVGSRGLTFGSR